MFIGSISLNASHNVYENKNIQKFVVKDKIVPVFL